VLATRDHALQCGGGILYDFVDKQESGINGDGQANVGLTEHTSMTKTHGHRLVVMASYRRIAHAFFLVVEVSVVFARGALARLRA
jgi:hypothetical protein